MKQNITQLQANEIASWDNTLRECNLFSENQIKSGVTDLEIANALTVGKMIEILEAKTNYSQQIINEGGRYAISVNEMAGPTTGWMTEYHNELCDALWEAVCRVIYLDLLTGGMKWAG